jgi:hypothetical protein
MVVSCKSKGLLIDENSRVFPCCYLATMEKKSPMLSSLDRDWNDLKKNDLIDILNHPVFREYLTPKNWAREKTCDPVCLKKCKIND